MEILKNIAWKNELFLLKKVKDEKGGNPEAASLSK